MKSATWMTATALLGMTFMAAGPVHAAVDADAARALAKGNDCLKCHAIDKDKKGPSLQKIAAKYKGKADGQDKVVKSMTDGKKVKMSASLGRHVNDRMALRKTTKRSIPKTRKSSKTWRIGSWRSRPTDCARRKSAQKSGGVDGTPAFLYLLQIFAAGVKTIRHQVFEKVCWVGR